LQVVGESGPELAALPQGTQVVSNTESKQMLEETVGSASRDAMVAAKLDDLNKQVANLRLTADASGVHLASEDQQSELERTGARMYPAP